MSVSVNRKYVDLFINESEREYLKPYVEVAHNQLHSKKGQGNDFWAGSTCLLIMIRKSSQE